MARRLKLTLLCIACVYLVWFLLLIRPLSTNEQINPDSTVEVAETDNIGFDSRRSRINTIDSETSNESFNQKKADPAESVGEEQNESSQSGWDLSQLFEAELEEMEKLFSELGELSDQRLDPSISQAQKSVGWVEINGVKYELIPGQTIEVEYATPGTWDPRPRTPEEQRRYGEISDLLLTMDAGDPRLNDLVAELRQLNAETSLPGRVTHRVVVK